MGWSELEHLETNPKLILENMLKATTGFKGRDTLGTGKALTGHTGNRISTPRYKCTKALELLGNHTGSGLAVTSGKTGDFSCTIHVP